MSLKHSSCSRRDILKATACPLLVAMLSGLSTGCGLLRSDLELAARRLIETLNHRGRAREIGEDYLVQMPDTMGRSPEHLTRELLVALDVDPEDISGETLNMLNESLRNRVRQDFVDENVVVLGKWMLSRTEALVCALAASQA